MAARLLSTIVTAAIAWHAGSLPARAQQPREIVYGLPSKSLIASVPRIADEMGLFEKYGLKPKFTYIDSTAGTATALLSKSVDVATTGTTEVIAAAARDQHLVIVANHYNGLAGSLVLSKATINKLGISPAAPLAERLKALNNLSIASVSKISTFTIAYKGAASSAGAEPRFSYTAVSAMGVALDSGAVDGMIVTAPFWTVPVLKGTGVVWLSPAKGDLPAKNTPSSAAITASTKAFADANPDVVRRIASVFDDLAAAFAERPADVKAAIARLFPTFDGTTIDLILSLEGPAFRAKVLTREDVAHDIEFMKASGLEFGPIEKVDPGATLVRR
jgi:ABC-type nitrate/sulfonate/bicarbonate transport system substrate-binding protein